MRFLGRTLFVTAVSVVLLAILAAALREGGRGAPVSELPLETRESVAYTVDARHDVEFRLSGHADLVRLRTHGLVPRYEGEMSWGARAYALRIGILAADGTELAERIEHYRTTVVRFRDVITDRLERVNFVDDPSVDVIGTALTILNLSGLPSAEILRIRVVSADPDIREIGVRVYEPEAIPEHSIAASWQRLSLPQRERLAEGNVFPVQLLSEEETVAIMSRRWRPVGPSGIEGEDYGVRTLHIREERGGPADRPLIPTGLYVDAQRVRSLAVPEAGSYLVRAVAVPGQTGASDPMPALKLELGTAPAILIPWSGRSAEQIVELGAGILTIRSERPAALRIFRVTPEDRIELTPSRRTIRAFRVSSADPLDFNVRRVFDGPAVLRLDLRRWLNDPQEESQGAVSVIYSALDAAGQTVDSGSISVGGAPSSDAGLVDDPAALLSEPVRGELALPVGVVRLRLSADRPVYVTAYSRMDAGTSESSQASDLWFSLMPAEGKRLIRDARTIVVVESSEQPMLAVDDDEP